MMNILQIGQVVAHVPQRHSVMCSLKTSGEVMTMSVQVPFAYADSLRVSQAPLPGLGSLGLIAFPYGDALNAVWLGTMNANLTDAVHTNGDAFDPYIDYDAHFSGHWRMLDGQGNCAMQFADGSSIVMGSSTSLPQPYRHIVGPGQKRQRVPFTRAERIPNPPAPFVLNYSGADGVQLSKDEEGNVRLVVKSLNITVAGGKTLFIDETGMSWDAGFGARGDVVAGLETGDQIKLLTHTHPTAALGPPSPPTPT